MSPRQSEVLDQRVMLSGAAPNLPDQFFDIDTGTQRFEDIIASDPEGDALTFTVVTPPSNGIAFLPPGFDRVLYDPNDGFFGADSFVIQADDGTNTVQATYTWTVRPIVDDLSVNTVAGQSVSGQLTGTDVPGVTFALAVNVPPGNGTVNVNADGSFTYTPGPLAGGSDSFGVISVVDGVSSSIGTVSVAINLPPVDNAPTTPVLDVGEDVPRTFVPNLARFSDPDGDTLTVRYEAPAGQGSFTENTDGSWTYLSAPDFNGDVAASVFVTDGFTEIEAPLTVRVNPVNDPPVAQDVTFEATEDTVLTGQLPGFDVEGATLQYFAPPFTGPGVASIDRFTGELTYTPAENFSGQVTLEYDVFDGQLFSQARGQVTINVAPVNDAPVFDVQSFAVDEDGVLTGVLTATDVEGDSLTFSGDAFDDRLVVNSDGSFTFTPDADFNGLATFDAAVSDGTDETSGTFEVNVTPVNDRPVVSPLTYTIDEDGVLVGQLEFFDADGPGDFLDFGTPGGPPANGDFVLDQSTGAFTFTPDADFNGTTSFVYSARDQAFEFAFGETVTINVTPVDDAPTTSDVSVATDEDVAVDGVVTANDVDGDAITFAVGDGPANGSVVVNTDGTFTYTPDENTNGQDSFTVVATAGGVSVVSTVTVDVAPVNDAPIAFDSTETIAEDSLLVGQLDIVDPDGQDDIVSYGVPTLPTNGTIQFDSVTGAYTYTPNENFNGTDSFVYSAFDGQVFAPGKTVTVVITPVDDAPTTGDVSVSTDEDVPVDGVVTATDVDGDAISFALGDGPANGSAVVNGDGTFTYTPNANTNGQDSFTVIVTAGGVSVTSTVTVDVAPVDDAPTTSDVSISTDEDVSVDGLVTATDADGDAITFALGDGPTSGSVVVNSDGSFTYTPDADVSGDDSFTVVATAGGVSVTSTVSVSVAAVNDAPVADDAAFSIEENSAVGTVVGAATATDVDGDAVTFSIVGGNESGAFAIDAVTGVITVADASLLDFEVTPNFALTVEASDAELTDQAIVDIALTNVDEPVETIEVDIDLISLIGGSAINLRYERYAALVIRGADNFDVHDVDLDSLTLGVSGDEDSIVETQHGFIGYRADIDHDGDQDLVLLVDVCDLGLERGRNVVSLQGQLYDGTQIVGDDMVRALRSWKWWK